MAKLSANGTEVFRATKTIETKPQEDRDTDWIRYEYSFRSNGRVLRKITYHWKPDVVTYVKTRHFSPGWKQYAKWDRSKEARLREKFPQDGYEIT